MALLDLNIKHINIIRYIIKYKIIDNTCVNVRLVINILKWTLRRLIQDLPNRVNFVYKNVVFLLTYVYILQVQV